VTAGTGASIGQGGGEFPPTAWSLVERLRDPADPRVREYLDRMARLYWRPVYAFVRAVWKRPVEDAQDLTQSFFVHLLEGDLFSRADPGRGNFRRLLLAALRNFLANDARDAGALKRGGGVRIVPLEGEDGAADDPADPEALFEARWARDVLERSIDLLSERARPEAFLAFRRFHLEGQSVREIARATGATEAQVGHRLQDTRAALRRIVTDEIRAYAQDEGEVVRELDLLFRAWR
jgi:RNA polymerase sigma-70 factor (ECF subfamily)